MTTNNASESVEPQPENESFTPITSQEQLNKLLGERISRERRKYADYEDLKAKVAAYDKEAATAQSELEKAQQRAQDAETQLQTLTKKQQVWDWQQQVAADTGVPAQALRGSTLEEITEHATQLQKLFMPQSGAARAVFLPREGKVTNEHAALNGSELEDVIKRAVGII